MKPKNIVALLVSPSALRSPLSLYVVETTLDASGTDMAHLRVVSVPAADTAMPLAWRNIIRGSCACAASGFGAWR